MQTNGELAFLWHMTDIQIAQIVNLAVEFRSSLEALACQVTVKNYDAVSTWGWHNIILPFDWNKT